MQVLNHLLGACREAADFFWHTTQLVLSHLEKNTSRKPMFVFVINWILVNI